MRKVRFKNVKTDYMYSQLSRIAWEVCLIAFVGISFIPSRCMGYGLFFLDQHDILSPQDRASQFWSDGFVHLYWGTILSEGVRSTVQISVVDLRPISTRWEGRASVVNGQLLFQGGWRALPWGVVSAGLEVFRDNYIRPGLLLKVEPIKKSFVEVGIHRKVTISDPSGRGNSVGKFSTPKIPILWSAVLAFDRSPLLRIFTRATYSDGIELTSYSNGSSSKSRDLTAKFHGVLEGKIGRLKGIFAYAIERKFSDYQTVSVSEPLDLELVRSARAFNRSYRDLWEIRWEGSRLIPYIGESYYFWRSGRKNERLIISREESFKIFSPLARSPQNKADAGSHPLGGIEFKFSSSFWARLEAQLPWNFDNHFQLYRIRFGSEGTKLNLRAEIGYVHDPFDPQHFIGSLGLTWML